MGGPAAAHRRISAAGGDRQKPGRADAFSSDSQPLALRDASRLPVIPMHTRRGRPLRRLRYGQPAGRERSPHVSGSLCSQALTLWAGTTKHGNFFRDAESRRSV